MEKTKELQATLKRYVDLLKRVEKVNDLSELSALELEARNVLQLINFQAVAAGDDMYRLARDKRILLQQQAAQRANTLVSNLVAEAKGLQEADTSKQTPETSELQKPAKTRKPRAKK